jgi:hypothetical protein
VKKLGPLQINSNALPSYKQFLRYPEYRSKYTHKTGTNGESTVTDKLEEYPDIEVEPHLTNSKGTDIVIKEHDIGIELWNWDKAHCYNKRTESVIKNLEPFKHRFLMCSFITPETKKRIEEYYPDNPIKVIELGFQMLPEEYREFYEKNKATKGRKFSTKQIDKVMSNVIKSHIEPIWKNIGSKSNVHFITILEGYVYVSHNNKYHISSNMDFSKEHSQTKSYWDKNILENLGITENKTNKEALSVPKLDCFNCKKNSICPILQKLREIEVKRPSIRLVQSNINNIIDNKKNIDKQDFNRRRREWYQEFSKLWIEQQKCLNRRIYLHNHNSKYKLFEPIT